MGVFKFINIPVFLISLVGGLFAVYMTMPDQRKIYVYPTPDNKDLLQYKDKTGTCFTFQQTEVACTSNASVISPQS